MANPLEFDDQRVRPNVNKASTLDLLNRVTAFRAGMEPEAVTIIEAELRSRGVGPEEIAAHAEKLEGEIIRLPDGTSARCSFCHGPAVAQGWGWHRLWRRLPMFPRFYYYCAEHR